MTPFLTEVELAELTKPLVRPSARRRYLDRLGVPYTIRPDGQPVVGREVIARRLGGGAAAANEPAATPNEAALLELFARERKRA
jgi:hypothetical protein